MVAAQGESPAAEQALEKLCRTYWRPLYVFVRSQGSEPKMHKISSKSFLPVFSDGKISGHSARRKGVYVPTCLYRLSDFWRASGTAQTGLGDIQPSPSIPLDELLASERADFDLARNATPEELYERRWILTLLDQVLGRLEAEYRSAGKEALFYRAERLAGRRCGWTVSRQKSRRS